VLLVGTPDSATLAELHRHLEEFAKHRYPRALGQIVLNRTPKLSPDQISEIKKPLDHPILAMIGIDSFQEHSRSLAQALATRSDLYDRPRDLSGESSQSIRNRLHDQLLEATTRDEGGKKTCTEDVLESLLSRESALPASREVRDQVYKELVNEVTGLGPIEPLLQDPDIAEIMAYVGFDFILIDHEHGAGNLGDAARCRQ